MKQGRSDPSSVPTFKEGDTVRDQNHRDWGDGVVRKVVPANEYQLLRIEFPDGRRRSVLTATHVLVKCPE